MQKPDEPSSEDSLFHRSAFLLPFSSPANCHGDHNYPSGQFFHERSAMGKRKRKLSEYQVRTLEGSFEVGNRLEPERKIQLARALGLKRRQVAIWFQNRKARSKTKKLERDYDELRRRLEEVRVENEIIRRLNEKLEAEAVAIRGILRSDTINNLKKDSERPSGINSSDSYADINKSLSADWSLFRNSQAHSRKTEEDVQDESFSNLFCGIDDQTGLWTWRSS
ncbi:unnamed protein product [Spirodela intermedia]|uniref:Homeobox-leucine zipper protein n=1 Tax=Spirodela intermedia TaxID=51605 RepID=A0A7I8IRF5_SPIIN|nr:unnamed protein product [Spirodela intermedia]CAA6659531.1 unnamed protein product [Spirodela intermedia]